MATIETLLVKIEADTERLRRELARADQAVASSAKRIETSMDRASKAFAPIEAAVGKVNRVLGALGIGVGVGALAAFAKRALDAAGALGEMAQQAGVSTDFLQGLQFAAVSAGVSAQEVAVGMQQLSRRVTEAATEGGAAAATFNRLGIAVKDANGEVRTGEAMLGDLAERVKNAKTPTEAVAIAMEALGRSGGKLVPILSQGRDGIRGLVDEARNAGAVLSKDVIDASDRASDKLAQLAFVLEKRLGAAFAAFAPLAERAATQGMSALEGLAIAGQGLLPETEKSAARVSFELKTVLNQLDELRVKAAAAEAAATSPGIRGGAARTTLAGAKAEIERLEIIAKQKQARLDFLTAPDVSPDTGEPGAGKLGGANDPVTKRIAAMTRQIEVERMVGDEKIRAQAIAQAEEAAQQRMIGLRADETQMIGDLAVALEDLKQKRSNDAAAIDMATQAAQRELEAREAAGERARKLIDERDALARTYGREVEENDKLIEALKLGNKEYEQQKALLEILNRHRALGLPLVGEEVERAKRLAETIGNQREGMERLKAVNDNWRDAAQDAARAIGTAFEDATLRGEGMRGMLKGLAEDLGRIAMRVLVTKPMESALQSAFGGGTAAGSAGGGLGSLFGSLGQSVAGSAISDAIGLPSIGSLFGAGGGPLAAATAAASSATLAGSTAGLGAWAAAEGTLAAGAGAGLFGGGGVLGLGAAGGPVAIAGLAAAGLLGSKLLKGKPQIPRGHANINADPTTGLLVMGASAGDNGFDPNGARAVAQQVIDQVNAFLTKTGARFQGPAGGFITGIAGGDAVGPKSAEEAIQAALTNPGLGLGKLTGLTPEAIQKALADGLDSVGQAQDVQAQDVQDSIARAILQITDPMAAQLEALADEHQARLDAINSIGGSIVDAERLYGLERQQVLDQFREQEMAKLESTKGEIVNFFSSILGPLTSFRSTLSVGPDSALSPGAQLAFARGEFDQLYGLAQGGNRAAIDAFPTVAQQFLGASRAVNATGPGYASDFTLTNQRLNQVIGQVQALQGDGFANLGATFELTIQDQTAQLRKDLQTLTAAVNKLKAA